MKTRQEMIYDFMLALAANPEVNAGYMDSPYTSVDIVFDIASAMADKYIKGLGNGL